MQDFCVMNSQDALMHYGGDAWRNLWRAIDQRRIELGMSWRRYYAWAGVSRDTVVAMKDGKPIQSAHKLAGLSRAARWTPDSAQRVLEGLDPVVDDTFYRDAPEPAPVSEPTNADLARKLDGLDDHLGQLIDILGLRRDAERGLRDRTPPSTQRPASVESDET